MIFLSLNTYGFCNTIMWELDDLSSNRKVSFLPEWRNLNLILDYLLSE